MTVMALPPDLTVRELLVQLCAAEDAARALPSYIAGVDGTTVANPDHVDLVDLERQIVARLHAHRTEPLGSGPAQLISAPARESLTAAGAPWSSTASCSAAMT